jgi:hypothetical protein
MPGAARNAERGAGLSIRPQTLHLTPQYRRLRDAILRPHLRLTESRYFWERWKPRLGPDAAVLIMEVRDRCNRALATGPGAAGDGGRSPGGTEAGTAVEGVAAPADGCTVSAAELAAACGFSRVTLWRLLQREDVRRFVRVEHNYVYDRRLGKKRRTVSTYRVLMEDPLVDEDEPRLQQLLAAHAAAPPAPPPPAPPGVHFETEVVDNPRPTLRSETNRGGSGPKPPNVWETISNERLGANAQTAAPAPGLPFDPTAVAGGGPASPGAAPQRRPLPQADIWKRYPEIAHYVEEAEALLGDTHSRGFYIKALQRLYPGHMGIWQRALGLAREQQRIRRSRGALFTRLLRTFAAEAGVPL